MALLNGWRRWVLAARPATLWAAVAPVLVGSALAFDDGVFAGDRFVAVLAAAVLLQIGVNFANDLSDAVRGADTEHRVGPPRAVAGGLVTPAEMKRAIAVVFGAAVLIGAYLVAVAGPVILVIGVVSIVAALGYTGGPIPYGYRALGEVFVFAFFGLVATVGTRFVYDQTAPVDAWAGGVAMGGFAAAILVANNLRDIDTDATAGKRTLAVRLGKVTTRRLYLALVALPFVAVTLAVVAGWFPVPALTTVAAAPLLITPVKLVRDGATDRALIPVLVTTARTQIVFAALFAVGVTV